jgi:hypothetical protein
MTLVDKLSQAVEPHVGEYKESMVLDVDKVIYTREHENLAISLILHNYYGFKDEAYKNSADDGEGVELIIRSISQRTLGKTGGHMVPLMPEYVQEWLEKTDKEIKEGTRVATYKIKTSIEGLNSSYELKFTPNTRPLTKGVTTEQLYNIIKSIQESGILQTMQEEKP